jgi:hypothetical protein
LRASLEKAKAALQFHHSANPSAPPSRLKNVTIGDLVAQLRKESTGSLSDDDENEIWETIQVIATPSKFMSLLRSIHQDATEWEGQGIFDRLRRMQDYVHFPYIQRYWVAGQGSETDFPYVSKMSVKGPGSGIDLLQRMQ